MSESNYFLLSEKLQNGIKDKLRWKELTLIQEATIPTILNGDNCVLIAPTAGGKTEAAFIPILETVLKEELKPISVIYVSPIRALLNNQEKRLQRLDNLLILMLLNGMVKLAIIIKRSSLLSLYILWLRLRSHLKLF